MEQAESEQPIQMTGEFEKRIEFWKCERSRTEAEKSQAVELKDHTQDVIAK